MAHELFPVRVTCRQAIHSRPGWSTGVYHGQVWEGPSLVYETPALIDQAEARARAADWAKKRGLMARLGKFEGNARAFCEALPGYEAGFPVPFRVGKAEDGFTIRPAPAGRFAKGGECLECRRLDWTCPECSEEGRS